MGLGRRAVLAIAVALAAAAILLAVSGGFRITVGGLRISARSPIAASVAALITATWWLYLARRERAIAADLEKCWSAAERNASRFIGVIALASVIVAATFATRSAAGADASGYLSQADMWAKGESFHFTWGAVSEPFQFPDHDAWLTTPLGWRPHDLTAGQVQVPTYPPGLPLLMAVPHTAAGLQGANGVVIAAAGISVWATGMLAGGVAGIIAAILIAFSPVFLYQSLQPMSDVPVTAAWLVCFLLINRGGKPSGVSSLLAGMACAIAVLIRPNLAPLAIVPLVIATNKITFALPVVLAGLFLGYQQLLWYGSPFQSGYGAAEELFDPANVGANSIRYAGWLVATAPLLWLAPFGFVRLRHSSVALGLAVFSVLVVVAYLIYAVFDQWSYLRFLLPAMAVFAVFAATALAAWIGRWPAAWRAPIFLALVLGAMAHGLLVARSLDTFKLADQLRRVEQIADYLKRNTPDYAVIISGEQSGAMRYYTGRRILRWEAAVPEVLSAAIGSLEASSRPVHIVLDAWENEPFMNKFKGVPEVSLDWPPAVDAGTSHRTKLWNLSDRGRFLKGEHIATLRLP